jgi:hypothetical protein
LKEHRNEADMVRDVGLAYRETCDNGHEIYCPVCQRYCGSKGYVGIHNSWKLFVTNQSIGRHLGTTRHKQSLDLHAMEMERQARRTRVGLAVGSYLKFEEKLLNLHFAGLDVGSMNHSVKFIERFVDSMAHVMERRIRDYLHAVDPVTSRKRLFAFAADKITKLHRTWDAIGMLIMTEEGEVKPLFIDYLLVTQHIGHALMRDIYQETFIKKLGLTPQKIRQQCTGVAFDGKYFCLNALEALASMMIERAKGTTSTAREIADLLEWLLGSGPPTRACRK